MQLEPIRTAPQTGAFIILHDQETGVYDVARWVEAEGRWSREQGDPIGINPTHWTYFPEGHASVSAEQGDATGTSSEFARPSRQAGRPFAGRVLAACCSTGMSAIMAVGLLGLSVLNNL
jgi:hypothetical protein